MKRLKQFIAKYYHIEPSEFAVVQFFLLYLAIISIFYVMSLSIGEALFLSHLSSAALADLLPLIYISIAFLTMLITWLYSQFIEKLSRIKLIVVSNFVIIACIILFGQLLNQEGNLQWIYFILLVWLEACCAFKLTGFFSYAGDYFPPRDARRVYGYITIGLALGSVMGGGLVSALSRYMRVESMLYILIFILFIDSLMPLIISRIVKPFQALAINRPAKYLSLKNIFDNRYLNFVFLIVAASSMSFVFADYQMLIVASDKFKEAGLVEFFGFFFAAVGVAQLTFELLWGGFLLRRFGVLKNLFVLPVLLLIGNIIFFQNAILFFAASINLIYLTLSETLDLTSRELLFLPLPMRTRVYSQTFGNGLLAPLGMMTSGFLLFILGIYEAPIQYFTLVFIIINVGWIVTVFFVIPLYKSVLADALQKRKLYTAELEFDLQNFEKIFDSKENDLIVSKILTNATSQDLIFLLNIFPNRVLIRFKAILKNKFIDANRQAMISLLKKLGEIGDSSDLLQLKYFLKDPHVNIKSAAIFSYIKLSGGKALNLGLNYFNHPNKKIQVASLASCYLFCGEAGRKWSIEYLDNMINKDPYTAIKIIETISEKEITRKLNSLLVHPDEAVRLKAMRVCRLHPDPTFIKNLIVNLEEYKSSWPFVLQILSAMPTNVNAKLIKLIRQKNLSDPIQGLLLKALGKIGGEDSKDFILNILMTEKKSLPLLIAACQALQWLVLPNHLSIRRKDKVVIQFRKKIYQDLLSIREIYSTLLSEGGMLKSLFYDTFLFYTTIFFCLLSLEYKIKDLNKVGIYIISKDGESISPELMEFVEASLSHKQFKKVMALYTPVLFNPLPVNFITLDTLISDGPWLHCLGYLYAQHFKIKKNKEDVTMEDQKVLTMINTIVLLKKIELFSTLSSNDLVSLAEIVHEDYFNKGDCLFREGDKGNALYLIWKGKVSVERNQNEVAQLGPGECFGELALLDKLPRSATVTALKETHTLRIDAADFEQMLLTNPQIALSLLKILSRRLREVRD